MAVLMIVSIPMATAQSQTDVGPGMVGADSPIYGLEVAWDNAANSMGLKKAGDIAQERAAEAKDAAERNKTKAAAKAAVNTRKIAERADGEEDEEGVQKAMSSLEGTMNMMEQRMSEAPNEQARQGMQTALDNMQGALDNIEEAKQTRDEARQRDQQERSGNQDRNATSQNRTSEENSNQTDSEDSGISSPGTSSER